MFGGGLAGAGVYRNVSIRADVTCGYMEAARRYAATDFVRCGHGGGASRLVALQIPARSPLMNDGLTESHAPSRRRRKSRLRLVIVVLAIAAAGAGFGWYRYQAGKAAEGEYIFAAVTTGDLEDLVSSTGTLQPRD